MAGENGNSHVGWSHVREGSKTELQAHFDDSRATENCGTRSFVAIQARMRARILKLA